MSLPTPRQVAKDALDAAARSDSTWEAIEKAFILDRRRVVEACLQAVNRVPAKSDDCDDWLDAFSAAIDSIRALDIGG